MSAQSTGLTAWTRSTKHNIIDVYLTVPYLKDEDLDDVTKAYSNIFLESGMDGGLVLLHKSNVSRSLDIYATKACLETCAFFKRKTSPSSPSTVCSVSLEGMAELAYLVMGYQMALKIPRYAKYARYAFDSLLQPQRGVVQRAAEQLKCDLALNILKHPMEQLIVDGHLVSRLCSTSTLILHLNVEHIIT